MHQDKRGYWYRSKREGKGSASRVVREYLGGGQHWAALAVLEDIDGRPAQFKAWKAKAELKKVQAQVLAVEEPLARLWRLVEGARRVALESAGYHQHKRGEWRKRRQQESTMPKSTKVSTQTPVDLAQMATSELIVAANKSGGEAAAAEMFKRVRGTPEERDLLALVAGVAELARSEITKRFGNTPLVQESFARQVAQMQAELGGPCPSSLERLLVERIVNGWLQVHYIELLLNRQEVNNRPTVEYLERRLDRAHARYLTAIKSLAQVRKLALPAAQVQINVGSHVAANMGASAAQQQVVAGAAIAREEEPVLVSSTARASERLGIGGTWS